MPKQAFTHLDLANIEKEINEHSVYELRLISVGRGPFTGFAAFVVAELHPITKREVMAFVRDTPSQGIAQEIARNHLVAHGFETDHTRSHVWAREV